MHILVVSWAVAVAADGATGAAWSPDSLVGEDGFAAIVIKRRYENVGRARPAVTFAMLFECNAMDP